MSTLAVLAPKRSILSEMKAEREDGSVYHVRDFLAFAEKRGEVTYKAVADNFRALNGKPYANSTKGIKPLAVKARLRTVLADVMDFNQAAEFREALARLDREVKAPKVQVAPIGADKVIRGDELYRLLAMATKRDACFLRFLWVMGARISELTGPRLDRCQRQGGRLDRPPYVSWKTTKARRRILGRRISTHTMRLSLATLVIRGGASIKAVSEYLGHSSTRPACCLIFVNRQAHEEGRP